jgi:phospholipid N-methyltransferase
VLINPMQVGAIAPSGPDLARVIVDTAQIEVGHTIVELGAGSGSFTREIVNRHPDNRLFAFEIRADSLPKAVSREYGMNEDAGGNKHKCNRIQDEPLDDTDKQCNDRVQNKQ